jgi:hypothetical protein
MHHLFASLLGLTCAFDRRGRRGRVLFAMLAFTGLLAGAAVGPAWMPTTTPWDPALGSHRVVVRVAGPANAVRARLEWRRRDRDPEKKAVLVYELQQGRRVTNVVVRSVDNVAGDIVFQPVSGAGEYAVYFLPVTVSGGSFPVSHYREPEATADPQWAAAATQQIAQLPAAEPARWEALSEHDAWNEMEVIATPEETAAAARRAADGFRVFVSGPDDAVRMPDRLPRVWATAAPDPVSTLAVQRGEYAVFQVAVWAAAADLADVRVTFPAEQSTAATPGLKDFICLSTHGVDWLGKPFVRRVDVPRGSVQAFWCGVAIPETLPERMAEIPVQVRVQAEGRAAQDQVLRFKLKPGRVRDHGDADPKSFSRLRWLNSTTAEDDAPTRGYEPLHIKGRTIACLGRAVELNEQGLPVRISMFFNAANTRIEPTVQQQLLTRPVELNCTLADGRRAQLRGGAFRFVRRGPGRVAWTNEWRGDGLTATLQGEMEFDGSLHYRVALAATAGPVSLSDVRLEFSRSPETTRYALGLQLEAGTCPDQWDWHWDVAHKNQDSVWLGAVNGGLRVQLLAENYVLPAVNIHYAHRPLHDPPSWSGGGVGGMQFRRAADAAVLGCFSGPRQLAPGQPLHFDFNLLVTPFHTLPTAEQWRDRYYHTGSIPHDLDRYLDQAKADGANIVNFHQGNRLNPYINYPFITWEQLRDASARAHERGLRTKYYYTVRELSCWATELFALRSLGDEILLTGNGGGHPWGEEHLGGNYWQAWYEPQVQDVSFLTQTLSRWDNYYIEGLRWLCQNAGCDGLYLDDIAYNRDIMLRVRKVLDRDCPRGGLIDLHSWNEFQASGAWAHCANLFMDSLPFVDRLWFGEEHQYAGPPPEHFLVEISGVPFGLMGEMLQGGGNPWLGLVFGCTARLGWGGDPRPAWKLWDDFGVQDAEFIGWWADADCPVRCADPDVKVSVWRQKGKTLVAVGNFAATPKSVTLQVDWQQLGLKAGQAEFFAPAIPAWGQSEQHLPATAVLPLKPFGGAALILR